MIDKVKGLFEAINEQGGIKSYKASGNTKHVWNAAYVMFKKHNPKSSIRKGCDSCMRQVYQWLSENA